MRAEGVNGQVELDGGMLSIQRKGAMARATVGKGEKRIPVKQVQAVQWKPASKLTRGFIQFSLGGSDAKGRAADAAKDENSVLFNGKQQADFEAIRSAVEQAIVEA
jgi:hypothetical protein